MKMHQIVREGTPDSHLGKASTPTMGGLILLIATLFSTVLWARLDNRYVILAMISMLWMGVIGGGVGNVDRLYRAETRASIRRHLFNPEFRTELLRPTLGDSAGVFGAALLARTTTHW